jgi:hypothetical protein
MGALPLTRREIICVFGVLFILTGTWPARVCCDAPFLPGGVLELVLFVGVFVYLILALLRWAASSRRQSPQLTSVEVIEELEDQIESMKRCDPLVQKRYIFSLKITEVSKSSRSLSGGFAAPSLPVSREDLRDFDTEDVCSNLPWDKLEKTVVTFEKIWWATHHIVVVRGKCGDSSLDFLLVGSWNFRVVYHDIARAKKMEIEWSPLTWRGQKYKVLRHYSLLQQ